MTPIEESAVQAARNISSQFEHVAPEFILELLQNFGALPKTQARAPESWEIDEAQLERLTQNGAKAWADYKPEPLEPVAEGTAVAQLMQDPDTGKRYVQYFLPLSLLAADSVLYVHPKPQGESGVPSPSPAELKVKMLDWLIDNCIKTDDDGWMHLDYETSRLSTLQSDASHTLLSDLAAQVGADWNATTQSKISAVEGDKSANKEVPCNPHPKAPHGFNRNASHSAGRYVCDCEGWDAWSAGYDEGMQAAIAAETAAELSVTENEHLEACTAALARHCAQAGSDSVLYATEYGDTAFAVSVEKADVFNARMQAPIEVDWQPAETAPFDEIVLVAAEFFGPGDWRIKCGGRSLEKGWQVWGASWTPTRWAKLPKGPSDTELAIVDMVETPQIQAVSPAQNLCAPINNHNREKE